MSRYSKLLAQIIAESGYTAKEIVEKCNEIGNGIDTTRLSKLQSGKLSAPSEKVSRDISRVCNVDERLLVIEGYLEKAPKEIIETFEILQNNTYITALKIFEKTISKEKYEVMKEQLKKEPLSKCIIEILNSKNNMIKVKTDKFDIENKDFKFTLEEPLAIQIKDNAMFPIIPKNSKITFTVKEKYDNGDILALKIKKQEDIITRYVLFNNDNIILTSLNKEYETLTYKKQDIIILGKVSKIITNI